MFDLQPPRHISTLHKAVQANAASMSAAVLAEADMRSVGQDVAFDPTRISTNISCCSSEARFSPFQIAHLNRAQQPDRMRRIANAPQHLDLGRL